MKDIPLGRHTPSPKEYDPTLLFPIARPDTIVTMFGFDLWRSYELAWLDKKGKPCIGILEIIYPRQSKNIVESKSMKLYLHGLSNKRFESSEFVSSTVRTDLEKILQTPWLIITIYDEARMESMNWHTRLQGRCIDFLDVDIHSTQRDPSLLNTININVEEILYSHVLRTYCPITHQPDWGSVIIEYTGKKISETSLLEYLCSYRNHEGFGEQCCEQIFTDISARCSPMDLTVSCLFTRRGGIDINPVRSSNEINPDEIKSFRIVRQ